MFQFIRLLIHLYCEKCGIQTVHELIAENEGRERYQCQVCLSEQEFAVR